MFIVDLLFAFFTEKIGIKVYYDDEIGMFIPYSLNHNQSFLTKNWFYYLKFFKFIKVPLFLQFDSSLKRWRLISTKILHHVPVQSFLEREEMKFFKSSKEIRRLKRKTNCIISNIIQFVF